MDILDRAIQTEGAVGKLADALGVRQNVVSNWRARGLPKPWARVLQLTYGEQIPPPGQVGDNSQPPGVSV